MVKLRRGLLVTFALCGGSVACAFGLDGFAGGDGAVPIEASDGTGLGDATSDAGVGLSDAKTDGPFTSCPSGRGPEMVLIDDGKGTRFCIDSTEVTNAQYAAFINSSPKTTGQPDVCASNTTFVPSNTVPFENIAKTGYPVTYVDWCDARAFCAWAGKRLCGRIGGGSLTSEVDRTDPLTSQLMYVCTKGSTQLYAYGTTYRPGICNANGGGGAPFPVNAGGPCVGGFAGVVYLVGNVGEWTDDCATKMGAGDACPVNASSYFQVFGDPKIAQRCDHFDPQLRGDSYEDLGFRCCFD